MVVRFLKPFADLASAPRGLWYIMGAFVAESTAYFGILTLMTLYFSKDLHWPDAYAGITVSVFTMLVTLFMLGVGSFAEALGLRRAIAVALLLSMLGRAIYCSLPNFSGQGVVAVLALLSLVVVAAGSGILMPTCYSGVKQFTDAKTNSMGYAMIYALMNLGIVAIGALSAWVRPGVQAVLDHSPSSEGASRFMKWLASFCVSGVQAVNWLCCGITGLTLLVFLLLMTRKAESARLRPDIAPAAAGPQPALATRVWSYFSEGPFGNLRFLFFIFMLLPVRTLFAHQWLTMPEYILRSYSTEVGDKMEWLVNWINPLIIFVGVPLATVLTRRFHVYTMMVVGSLVSAAPTFLLCFGPNLKLLLVYFVVFSIGEALWSARFLEYASELAPPGRVAQYMGLANIPWLLAKGTTGLYSGYLLARLCPANTPAEHLHTGTLWLVYGSIAMISPIGLWLARNWVQSGLHHSEDRVSDTGH
jgi:proton-dependent oligopeptide transporter, POT family